MMRRATACVIDHDLWPFVVINHDLILTLFPSARLPSPALWTVSFSSWVWYARAAVSELGFCVTGWSGYCTVLGTGNGMGVGEGNERHYYRFPERLRVRPQSCLGRAFVRDSSWSFSLMESSIAIQTPLLTLGGPWALRWQSRCWNSCWKGKKLSFPKVLKEK